MYTIADLVELRDEKVREHNDSLAYYDATKNPRYMTDRMREFFNSNAHYKLNWLSLIVDAVRSKLNIEGFAVADDDNRSEALNAKWDLLQMAGEADTVHEYAHAVGEGFIVAGLDKDGHAVAYANDPRCVHVVYGGEDPREITQAVKFWLDGKTHKATAWSVQDDGRVYEETLTGRSTTETDKVRAQNEAGITYDSDGDPVATAYPRIPVFHFRRSARNIKPEFYQVQAIQDTVNKTFVALGFSSEHAADKIRWAITNADLSGFKRAEAGAVVAVPPADTHSQPVSFGEFTGADIDKMLNLLASCKQDMASITQTPAHYLSQDGVPMLSGEALQALEAPLVAKVQRYARRYAPVWESLGAFLLTADNMLTTTDEVTCIYADPRTKLATSTATTRQSNTAAGVPILWQLREEGYRQNDLDKLLEDRVTEQGSEIDDAAREQVYDVMAEKASMQLKPMLDTALQMISDAAVDKVANDPKLIDRLAAQAAPAQPKVAE